MKEQWQYKLYNYQAQPPAELWDNIASSLDDEKNITYPERLYNYEEKPPQQTWDKILKEIETEETPVIPIRRRFSKTFKYGSVAAALIAVSIIVSLLITKQSVSGGADNTLLEPTSSALAPLPDKSADEINATEVSEDADQTYNSLVASSRKTPQNRKLIPLSTRAAVGGINVYGNRTLPDHRPIVPSGYVDRYIVFSTASGDAIKLSKKLFSLFACYDDEVYCRQNIEMMQQQIASPALMASSDFTEVLDLLQNMNTQ